MGAKFNFKNMDRFKGVLLQGVQRGSMAVAKVAQNSMRDNFSRVGRYASSAPGQPPNIRRGFLRRSIQVRPKGEHSAEVWSDAVYARILDQGGVIRPKSTKYLPVPLNDAAKRFMERKGTQSLRSFPFKFSMSRSRKMFLTGDFQQTAGYYTDAKGKRVRVSPRNEPRFILKKSIRIEKRPYVQPTLDRIKGAESLKAFKVGIDFYIARRFGAEFKI